MGSPNVQSKHRTEDHVDAVTDASRTGKNMLKIFLSPDQKTRRLATGLRDLTLRKGDVRLVPT